MVWVVGVTGRRRASEAHLYATVDMIRAVHLRDGTHPPECTKRYRNLFVTECQSNYGLSKLFLVQHYGPHQIYALTLWLLMPRPTGPRCKTVVHGLDTIYLLSQLYLSMSSIVELVRQNLLRASIEAF